MEAAVLKGGVFTLGWEMGGVKWEVGRYLKRQFRGGRSCFDDLYIGSSYQN